MNQQEKTGFWMLVGIIGMFVLIWLFGAFNLYILK
jgi:predicted membrane-bound dolichyl-phosphate-mannose-protein mannosyltransferase